MSALPPKADILIVGMQCLLSAGKRTWLVAFVPLGGHPHERKEEMSMQRKLALDKMNSREEINRR